MHIGLDIHGVIDKFPEIFSKLSKEWTQKGHEISIITGQEWNDARPQVDLAGIVYHHHFSIVDHHKKLGTPMYRRDDKKGWWMDHDIWVRSKGDYAKKVGLNLHFDDSLEYAEYFPKNCIFVLTPPEGFDNVWGQI